MNRDERQQAIRRVGVLCSTLKTETNDEKANALIVDINLELKTNLRSHMDQLGQLFKSGPVWDGDVMSKADRGDLIKWGLASRVIVRGQWGFTASTYLGGHVYSAPGNYISIVS